MAPGTAIEIAVDAEADRLHVLGNATIPDGYPTQGTLGSAVGAYVVFYADGDRQEFPLRWGYEVARSNRIAVATRLNPVAVRTAKVIEYTKDPSREDYQTLLLTLPVKHKRIARLRVALDRPEGALPPSSLPSSTGSNYRSGDHFLLVYAVTAEREGR